MITHFDYVSATALIVSCISLSLVLIQLYENILQRRIDADLKISDVNRQLISLGFEHPILFAALDGEDVDPVVRRRYLQLWFNQFDDVFTYRTRGFFAKEVRDSLERDLSDFLTLPSVRRHWDAVRQFYKPSFQTFVNSLLPPAVTPGD